MTRAALYARVSTGEQDPENQLRELRAFAERQGWEAVEFTDHGVSGAKASRPALDALMADARARRFDVVAVWAIDRMGRNLRHLLAVVDELEGRGVRFVSLTQPIDTKGPAGKLVLQILAAAAEFERAMIRERVKAGQRKAKAGGKHIGRKPAVVDIEQAERLLKQAGSTLAGVAKALGVGRSTLARELRKARQEAVA